MPVPVEKTQTSTNKPDSLTALVPMPLDQTQTSTNEPNPVTTLVPAPVAGMDVGKQPNPSTVPTPVAAPVDKQHAAQHQDMEVDQTADQAKPCIQAPMQPPSTVPMRQAAVDGPAAASDHSAKILAEETEAEDERLARIEKDIKDIMPSRS